MTLDTAARFGVEISQRDYEEFYIRGGQHYRSACFSIEGDWSAAAMLLVAGAVAGEVTVRNVSMLSKQADTAICTALVRAGAAVINEPESVTASTVRSTPSSSTPPTAPTCSRPSPPSPRRPTASARSAALRGCCTRRATAPRRSAKNTPRRVSKWTSRKRTSCASAAAKSARRAFPSHDDHRMAMSMAVSALRCDGEITIENAECVAKSYPGFFEDLEKIRV